MQLLNGHPLALEPLIFQGSERVLRVYEGFEGLCD
jgi:hypothetical protein